jgi:hypothetical protein
MAISYNPVSSAAPNAGSVAVDSAPTGNSSQTILGANSNRLAGAMIINNTNGTIWFRLGSVAATIAGPNCIALPGNGSTYDIPESWKGAIQAINTEVAPTGACVLVEPRI